MTKILTYTPMIKAKVACRQSDGNDKVYDLSDDITNFRINLNTDACSTFSISLQNKKSKYNGVFTPMDRIVISLVKSDETPVFAGYITTCDFWSLYGSDFNIQGKCTLYRLNALYWDSGLVSSQLLLMNDSSLWTSNEEYWRSGVNVLTTVANWDPNKISIGQMPEDVVEWAVQMYQTKLEDTQGADLVNQIYEMLKTSGPQIGTTGTTGFTGTASSEAVEAAVQWAINICNDDSHGYSQANRTGNPDYDCSSLVYYSLLNNGWTQDQLGSYAFTTYSMDSQLPGCGWTKYPYNNDVNSLQRGDIMWRSGHTEWYIGGGQTAGAHSSRGNPQAGDQTGTEISVVNISGGWTHYFRFTGV